MDKPGSAGPRENCKQPHEPRESSLADIHARLGLKRRSLEECLTATREHRPLDAFSVKEQMGALEAIIIEDIWPEIDTWIRDHADVHGFLTTNLPDLRKYASPEFENSLPRSEAHLTCKALSPADLENLRNDISTLSMHEKIFRVEPYARTVLHAFLFRWELRRLKEKERRRKKEPISPSLERYNEYVTLVGKHLPQVSMLRYPVTHILQSGFAAGPAMLFVFPHGGEVALSEKLAHTHNMVMRFLGPALELFPSTVHQHETTKGDDWRCTLSPVLLNELLRNIDMVETHMKSEELHGNPTAMPIITGCSAYYTPMFAGVREWIVNIKQDLLPEVHPE